MKKKILVVTLDMDLGGITSFVINLVNFLAKEGHIITLMYTSDKNNMLERINQKVELLKYDRPTKKYVAIKSILSGYLIDLLKIKFRNHKKVSPISSTQKINFINAKYTEENIISYDVAISSAEFYCNNYVAFNTKAHKKIGWIHPDYKSMKVDVKFDLKTLNELDHIVTVSKQSEKSILEVIPTLKDKVIMIENILDEENIINKSKESIDDFDMKFDGMNIVTVCRLDNSSKRIDRAIVACRYLIDSNFKVKWYLVGEGKDKDYLEQMVSELKLKDHFIMLGSKSNPYPYIKKADLFVLTSQYEGKPIVIDEALILKCPVMVTNYQSASEQVNENFGKILPNDDDDFKLKMLEVLRKNENIIFWKNNLMAYEIDNSMIYRKIRELIEEEVV